MADIELFPNDIPLLASDAAVDAAMARHLTRSADAYALATEAFTKAQARNDVVATAWAQLALALVGYRLIDADLVELEKNFKGAREKMAALADARGLRLCSLGPAVLASKRGQWAEALAHYEGLIGTFDLDAPDADNFYVFIGLSTAYVYCGNLAEGLRFGYAGVQHAQQLGLVPQEVVMCLPLGVALMAARDVDEAAMLFGTAERLCEQIDSPVLLKTVRINRAIALRRLRRYAEAKRLMQWVIQEPAAMIGGQAFVHYAAAELHIQLDEFDAAETQLHAARALHGGAAISLLDQAKLGYIAGLIASRRGDDERAIHELGRVAEMLPRLTAWRFSDRTSVYDELAAAMAKQGRYYDAYLTQKRSSEEFLHSVDVLNRVRHFSMQIRHEMNRVQAELQRTSRDRLHWEHEQRVLRAEIERTAREALTLKEAATTDALTGLPNRRYLDDVLPGVLRMRQQTATPLALAFLDLDHFKEVNDQYGHAMGDQVLRGFSELASHAMRTSDIVGRYGGEEFCVAMVGCGPQAAATRLRALLKVFSKRCFTVGGTRVEGITFSAGIAVYPEDGIALENLLSSADRRLYEAKRSGRARVIEVDFPIAAVA